MKVAARFPIKSNTLLYWLIVSSHLGVLIVGVTQLNTLSAVLLVLVVTVFSYDQSYAQYKRVTEYDDDLCWSGDNWLVHVSNSNNLRESVGYLELLESSWITAEFSLLKFDANTFDANTKGGEVAWLFTRKCLGERLYSELCYLARLNLKHRE